MPTLKAPGLMHFELRYDGPNSNFAFKFNVCPYTAAAAASPAAPVPAILTNPVQSGFSFWKKPASFQYALAPKQTKVHPHVLPGKSGKAGKVGQVGNAGNAGKVGYAGKMGNAGQVGTVAAAAGADGAMTNVFSMVDSVRGNVEYHVNNAIDTVGDKLEEAEERLKDVVGDMSGDVKAMLAARTLSLREISVRRMQ
jgi:hypothetical protein